MVSTVQFLNFSRMVAWIRVSVLYNKRRILRGRAEKISLSMEMFSTRNNFCFGHEISYLKAHLVFHWCIYDRCITKIFSTSFPVIQIQDGGAVGEEPRNG